MTDLEFLNGEAKIASAFAPEGAQLAVVLSARSDRYDVLVGQNAAARLLSCQEALACIMGAGGAFASVAHFSPISEPRVDLNEKRVGIVVAKDFSNIC